MNNKPGHPHTDDIPELKALWNKVFGKIGLEAFFSLFFNVKHCQIIRSDNNIAAMGFMLPAGDFVYKKRTFPCAMIYSVATLSQYRGLGFGTDIANSLINTAYDSGYPVVVLCPATDSLFEYYSRNTDFRDYFFVNEQIINSMPDAQTNIIPEQISASEYINLREELLKNVIHIKSSPGIPEYQQSLCRETGGGFYRIGDSCAAVECQSDGTVHVKELLVHVGSANEALSSIARKFPSEKYVVRTPVNMSSTNTDSRRFGMLTSSDKSILQDSDNTFEAWYGLAFD